jgi:hypothetical protein
MVRWEVRWNPSNCQTLGRLAASEQDESTEVPLLHLKSLYCFALLCFALLCFRSPAAPQALDLTCVGCCSPYIRLGWYLSGPRLALPQPAHHQALALSRAVPQ